MQCSTCLGHPQLHSVLRTPPAPVANTPFQICKASLSSVEAPISLPSSTDLWSSRRGILAAACLLLASTPTANSLAADTLQLPTVNIDLSLTPDQSLYDPSDPRLRTAATLIQEALNAEDVVKEEALWTKIITEYGNIDAPWVPDVVGRAWGNRGNARARQGRLQEALSDYNTAIKLCPWSVDPVLNRGVTLEALGRFPEAITDYKAVLKAAPEDPAAWNNLGNASAGMGDWTVASESYGRAAQLAPQFSFALANKAVADFQLGKDDMAFKQWRGLLRRYPEFAEARAALAAGLWDVGLQAQAEEEWGRVSDPRYRDLSWIKENRRWAPRLVAGLTAFLGIKDVQK